MCHKQCCGACLFSVRPGLRLRLLVYTVRVVYIFFSILQHQIKPQVLVNLVQLRHVKYRTDIVKEKKKRFIMLKVFVVFINISLPSVCHTQSIVNKLLRICQDIRNLK